MHTKELLWKYEELQAQRDLLASTKKALIDDVTPEEVRQAIAEIELEFAPGFDELDANIKETASELRRLVAESGEKVVGEQYQVVYVKPRTKVNTTGLLGYAVAHPEVAHFISPGTPSAQIQKRR
jgi:hypothetical protein